MNDKQSEIQLLVATINEKESTIEQLKDRLNTMEMSNRKKDKYIKGLETGNAHCENTEDMLLLRKTEIVNITDTMRAAKIEINSLPLYEVNQKDRHSTFTKHYYKTKLRQSKKLIKQQQQLLNIRSELVISMQSNEDITNGQILQLQTEIINNAKLFDNLERELILKGEQMQNLLTVLSTKQSTIAREQQLRIGNEQLIGRLKYENEHLKQRFREIVGFSKI